VRATGAALSNPDRAHRSERMLIGADSRFDGARSEKSAAGCDAQDSEFLGGW
jgi:hypothetical protein